jgi:hypothetical protein
MGTIVFAIHSPTQVGGTSHDPKEEKKAMKNDGRHDKNVPMRFQMSASSLLKELFKTACIDLDKWL